VTSSAWVKWARGVELQRELASATREYLAGDPYRYERWDNQRDGADPLFRVHWRLVQVQPFPQRWGVLLGGAVAGLRDALDHVLWAAVDAHTGPPLSPRQVHFPITTKQAEFANTARKLAPLVASKVWTLVERVQPWHAGDLAHTDPLAVLHHLSNVDKHRFVHGIDRTVIDPGPAEVDSAQPLEVVEDWRHEGLVAPGQVVRRLKLRRGLGAQLVGVKTVFSHAPTVQISDNPVAHRTLASTMDVLRDRVRDVLLGITAAAGLPAPNPSSLELGAHHESVAPEFGGTVAVLRRPDGTVHREQITLPDQWTALPGPHAELAPVPGPVSSGPAS
jgi:hypothetical protein